MADIQKVGTDTGNVFTLAELRAEYDRLTDLLATIDGQIEALRADREVAALRRDSANRAAIRLLSEMEGD